jgi:hypothetical protein
MPIGKFLFFQGLEEGFLIFRSREQIFASGLFKAGIAQPQAVNKVKVGAGRWLGVRQTTDEDGKKVIAGKFSSPFGKTGKFAVKHKEKGTHDLRLVESRTTGVRIKGGKKISHRIKIHGSKLMP